MKDEPLVVGQVIGKMLGGGVESVVMNYFRHIDRNKVNFDFIVDDDSTHIPEEEIKDLGGNVIIVPKYTSLVMYMRSLDKLFKQKQYKIVHSHINTLSGFPLSVALKNNIDVRIAHCHGTSGSKEYSKNIVKGILKPYARLFATDYFACSKDCANWMFKGEKYDNKVHILNNAFEQEKFLYNPIVRDQLRNKLGISKDTFVIGHAGRFVTCKNQMFLVDIFYNYLKKNNNSVLLLAGDGKLMNDVKNYVKTLGISNKVIFTGNVPNMNDYYQAMDYFIFPSLYEGLGLCLVEAQIAGLPCLASDTIPKDATISDNVISESLNNDPEYWASLIKKNNMRLDYNKELSKKFDINSEATKLTDYYLSKVK